MPCCASLHKPKIHITKGSQKKKLSDDIKDEHQDSFVVIEKTDETGVSDVVRYAKDLKEPFCNN